MMRPRRPIALALVALLVCSAVVPLAVGQESANDFHKYAANVLVENLASVGGDFLPEILRIVTKRVDKEFAANNSSAGISNVGLQFETSGGNPNPDRVIYRLTVYWRGSTLNENDSRAVWNKARKELEKVLQTVQGRVHVSDVAEREAKLEQLKQRRDVYTGEMHEFISHLTVLPDGSPEEARKELSATTAQLRQLQLEQIGVQARRNAIERRIDELRKLGDQGAADDPVVGELQKILAVREQQLARTRELREAHTISASDVQNAEAEFAEARIQLLKAQREATDRASGAALQQLNDELSTLMIQAAEFDEKIKATSEFVKELREQSGPRVWAEVDMVKERMGRVRSLLAETELALTELNNTPLAETKPIRIRSLEEALLGEEGRAEAEAPQSR